MTLDVLVNPWRDIAAAQLRSDTGSAAAAVAFHKSMPGYAPTELRETPELAERMRTGRVWLKIETERFGLPAFKILGASWAAERLLAKSAANDRLCLVSATDGNHGRALARVAKMRGLRCHILVPRGTAAERIEAIAGEGARVDVVDGEYDDAVRRAAELADSEHILLADTSWPGYEEVPAWVVEGYATIFAETTAQLSGTRPDVAWIPIGVGSLASAAARHWPGPPPRMVGVEPASAACAYRSIQAGERVVVPGPHDSIMSGLNCGQLSLQAWPVLRSRFDSFCSVDDELAEEGMRVLWELGIAAGEVSGGVVGCALAVSRDEAVRRQIGMTDRTSVLLLLTEGVTDSQSWQRIVASQTPGS